jgi:hypothetical protein
MADTTFLNGTVIEADWLQDVNDFVYKGRPLNLADFGADNTGLVDASAAFQEAIEAAKALTIDVPYIGAQGVSIEVPDGSYRIDDATVVLNGNGIGFHAAPGSRGARIFTTKSSNFDMFVVGDSTDTTNQWENHFINLYFEATNKECVNVSAIHAYRVFGGSIEKCVFHGFYESVVGERMNRWFLTKNKFWQERVTTIANASIRLKGLASGTGGGIHCSMSEFAGGGSLVPSVDAHILLEECDGFYGVSLHTRDCNVGFKTAPTGGTGKNVIDAIFMTNCYFDENYEYNVHLTGTVSAGGRYQQVNLTNCYYRGAGGDSTNGIRVSISNSGTFTGKVENFSFIGGACRQQAETGILVQGSSASRLEVYGLKIADMYFDDNNYLGATAISCINAQAETLTIDNCTFGQDFVAASEIINANLSLADSLIPSLVITNNDFSKSNCSTSELINYTKSVVGATVLIDKNVFPKTGRDVDQEYAITTTNATTTTLWTYNAIQQGEVGIIEVKIMGANAAGTTRYIHEFKDRFYRDSGNLVFQSGTDTATAVGTAISAGGISATLIKNNTGQNIIELRVTGAAATTIDWKAKVMLTMLR